MLIQNTHSHERIIVCALAPLSVYLMCFRKSNLLNKVELSLNVNLNGSL